MCFVFLHLVAVPGSASPKHTSNRSSPGSGRRTVVGTHCEFHLCVNKFWLALLVAGRRRIVGEAGEGATAHRH